ncbi:MAG TPA: hypothetical protein VKT49_07925 [Bryobacteraceae bacterium]|nr:hypothetical protein [Bryobacteraceae bacterium]
MAITVQMANVLGRRQGVQPSSALAEIVLLTEIRATLPAHDPLHRKIGALFDEEADPAHDWGEEYDQVLAEARRRIV